MQPKGGLAHSAAIRSLAPMSALAILLLACPLWLAPVSAATVRGRRTAATPAVFNGPNGPEARWVIDENEKRAAVLPLNPELPE